jgi:hypothetical protein
MPVITEPVPACSGTGRVLCGYNSSSSSDHFAIEILMGFKKILFKYKIPVYSVLYIGTGIILRLRLQQNVVDSPDPAPQH